MSTYIQNLTDYIPQVQPFRPDLNYYSNVLQTKQSQYNQGIDQVASVYGSVLNSPMTRADNESSRDNFLKLIDQDIKKVTALDLSKQSNVSAANQIFQPFLDDKNIIHDIAYTRKLQSQFEKAQALKNCTDPEKCGGIYSDTAVQALHYQAEEYKNASKEDALGYSAPEFVPFQDIGKMSIKAINDAKLKIKIDHVQNGYVVTDENGALMLQTKKGEEGVLNSFLYSMIGSNPAVQAMSKTQVYVNRKSYAKAHAGEYQDGETGAEAHYLTEILSKSIPKLEKSAEHTNNQLTDAQVRIDTIKAKYKDRPLIEGSRDAAALKLLEGLIPTLKQADELNRQNVATIKSTPNLSNLQQMRYQADAVVAQSNLKGLLDHTAYTYAMGTANRTLKADEFSLEGYKSSNRINEHRQAVQADISKMIELDRLGLLDSKKSKSATKEVVEQAQSLSKQGYDVSKMSPEQIQQVFLEQQTKGVAVDNTVLATGESFGTGYFQNLKTITRLNATNDNNSINATTNLLMALRKSNQRTDKPLTEEEKRVIRLDATDMLKNTGIDVEKVLSGSDNIETMVNSVPKGKRYLALVNSNKYLQSPGTVWAKETDKTLINNWLRDFSATTTIYKNLAGNIKDVLDNKVKYVELQEKEGKIDFNTALTKTDTYKYMYNKNGILNTYENALKDSKNTLLVNEKDYYKLRNEVESEVTAYNAGPDEIENVNSTAPAAARKYTASNLTPYTSVNPANQLASSFVNNENNFIVTSAENKNVSNFEDNPELKKKLGEYFNNYNTSKDKTKDVGFDVIANVIDENYFKGELHPAQTVYTVKLKPDGAKEVFGKNYKEGADYTYNVIVDSNKDPLQFERKTQKTAIDVAVSQKGQSITLPIKNGSYTMTNTGEGFDVKQTVNYYNPETKEYQFKTFKYPGLYKEKSPQKINDMIMMINESLIAKGKNTAQAQQVK